MKVEEVAPSKNGTEKPTASVVKTEPSQSERFTQEVMKQFTNQAGEVELTNFQRKLCQNYFIKIDQTLKDLEKKRMAKDEKYRDALAFTWPNVNIAKLAVDVVTFSAIGLDPTQPNHINCIPYKNTGTNKFDIGFIPGYRGMEVKAKKYGLDIPDDIIVELVYSNDKFKQVKRDLNNKMESYTFEVVNDFDRGELKGGFYYHKFFDQPEKNRLRVFSKADIEKRKPAYASPEFWGGEKDNWVNGQKQGKVAVVGWYDEMAYKTIYRAAYNAITIDSQKIDDHYVAALEKEREPLDAKVLAEIRTNANKGELVSFDESTDVSHQEAKELPASQPAASVPVEETKEESATTSGPGF
jgi:recombination protein RecT